MLFCVDRVEANIYSSCADFDFVDMTQKIYHEKNYFIPCDMKPQII